jgi:transposase InsO family protein
LWNSKRIRVSPSTFKRRKRKWRELVELLKFPAMPPSVWRFYERHHPHSLWHGDFLEKVTLSDIDQTAYHLALMDDYSRGYVFCDLFLNPDVRTTIRAIIAAMRQWQVIPKAIIFDNGSAFKGNLLSVFCAQVGIRLIHASVNHPQTNGKLEGGFRDDMRDFYKQRTPWLFEPLRRDLPAYVHYRNHVRGHRALGASPQSPGSTKDIPAPHLSMCSIILKAMPATKQDAVPCRLPGAFACSTTKPAWTRRLPIGKSSSSRVWMDWKLGWMASPLPSCGITAPIRICRGSI